MNYYRYKVTIESDEGCELIPYFDDADPPVATVGHGTTEYLPGHPVCIDDPPITFETAMHLMESDLWTSIEDAQSIFSTFDQMNDVRQETLANMAYNMGWNRLSKFVNTIGACDRLDFETAADEIIDSDYWRKLEANKKPHHKELRAERSQRRMRSGVF